MAFRTVTKDGQTTIVAVCDDCKSITTIAVEESQLKAWRAGTLIQNAMPQVPIDQRELLISGICGKCFDRLFGHDD